MKTILSLRGAVFFSAVLIISLFILSAASFAATFTVTNTNDAGAGSLRQAIEDANNNAGADDVVFAFGVTGTIPSDVAFSGQMVITDDVTITGPGPNLLTIDAQTVDRIFNIDDGKIPEIGVSISGLRFINGDAGGSDGGAIRNLEELSIDLCVFEDNEANVFGGAIYNDGTIEQLSNSTFSGNSAELGGAIVNLGGTIEHITLSTFSENIADAGGAILNSGTIERITLNTFSGNIAIFNDGAIRNFGAIGEIANNTFSGHMSTFIGGTLRNFGIIEQIANNTFSGNMSGDNGGAIVNLHGTIVQITNNTFSGNMAVDEGGAIWNLGGTIVQITNNTFSGNIAELGGAIYNEDGTIEQITNSTFTGNMAGIEGGAIWNLSTINISFSTIANNGAVAGGGIFNDDGATLNIKNSIVANNTGGDCSPAGTFTALGVNLDTDGSCPGFTLVTPADLNLDPTGLQDNGGPTQSIALISPSFAIDAIALMDCTDVPTNPVTTDQRFFTRPFPMGGSCDVGAFESQPTGKLTILKTTDPPGGMDFEFLGTGFPNGCGLMDTFFLNDTEMDMCILPLGMFTVQEFPPAGILTDITCSDSTPPDTPTSVTVDIGDMDDVTCTFNNIGIGATEVRIQKLTVPPGGTGFEFTTTGFTGLPGCDITDAFTLDNLQTAGCLVSTGIYTITEDVPEGQVLNILCDELPAVFNINPLTSTLEFTISDLEESVDCTFINSTANTLVKITEEPPEPNCEFGGDKVETGLDTNQNGVLDPDEVTNTTFLCNGAPGDEGPGGPEGPQGPQGPAGEDGGSKCSLAPANSINGPSALLGLLAYVLIPAAVLLRRRFRRK